MSILQDKPRFNPVNMILALDFDGVIVDSIAECLVVGHNAYQSIIGQSVRIEDFNQLSMDTQHDSHRLRNFIRHGEDYVYIFQAINENQVIRNQSDFDHFLGNNLRRRAEYRSAFYAERSRFLHEEPQRWLSLNPFYEGMSFFLRNYQPAERLYIITTKKTEYVQAILANAGIAIPGNNLFAADTRRGKFEIIGDLLKKIGTRPEDFYFIDDQVDTLLKLQALKVHLFLASWGYTNEQQIDQAKKVGIPVLTLSEFYQQF